MSAPGRRRWAITALALVAGAAACDRDEPPPLPGQIVQPVAAAVVGDRVFVATPGQNALKVLDLTVADGAFVRAPNPLFALDVPAVRRPTTLHALPGEGGRRGILVVLSALDGQLRLVDADRLVPLGRPVALPGRPVAVDHGPGGDVLFVVVDAPDDGAAAGGLTVITLSDAALSVGGTVTEGDSVVADRLDVSLDVRPGGVVVSGEEGAADVWVSDVGSAEVLHLDAAGETVGVVATGAPLSRLLASPALPGDDDLPRGRWVYGLTVDGDGLVAIDTEDGQVAAPQRVGETVLPMVLPARAVALSAVPRAHVDVGEGEDARRALQVPILVLTTLVDGRVHYAHGVRMVPVDVDGSFDADPSALMLPPANRVDAQGQWLEGLDASAPILETIENPRYAGPDGDEPPRIPRVTLTPGITRSRTWRIVFQGEVPLQAPALGAVVVDGDDARVSPVAPPDDLAERVLPGDILTITAWHGGEPPAGCEAYASADPLAFDVAEVDGDTSEIVLAVREGGPPLPTAACFGEAVVFRIRAAGYLVTATGIDTVWRVAPGEAFTHEGSRFMRTDPLVDGPELRFTLAEIQDEAGMPPGAERRLRVSSGLEPVLMAPDTAALGAAQASIPGQLGVHKPDTETFGSGRVFVPYAGPGYLVSFDLRGRGSQRLHR